MKKINEEDLYEKLNKMKWIPKSGEMEFKPFKKYEIIPVLKKGVFITDRQGMLIARRPEDIQFFSDILNSSWRTWAIPELNKRKEAKQPAPYPLKSIKVLFDKEGDKFPTVKFNDEYGFKVIVLLKKDKKVSIGEEITFDQLIDFEQVEPPMKDGKPIGFFLLRLDDKQIFVFFDFRPNDPKFDVEEWKNVGNSLANAFIDEILAKQFGHLMLIIPRLSNRDIPFTIGLKTEKMVAICNFINDGIEDEELNNKLSRLITRYDVKSLVDNWITLDLYTKRADILKEVLKAFKNGIYGAVILLLMSQVEGVITEELVLNNKGIKSNGKAKEWKARIKEFYEIEKDRKIGPMTSRILESACFFLNNSNLYNQFTWNSDSNKRVNRHAAMHGKDTTFNSRANAIRMILLFDALFWVFLAISKSKKEKHRNI